MAQSMQSEQRRNGAMRHNVRARANDVLDDFAELSKDVSRLADAAGKAARAEVKQARVVLETAIQGRATHVVSRDGDITRDTDLTEHLRKRGIETLTVQRFLDLL